MQHDDDQNIASHNKHEIAEDNLVDRRCSNRLLHALLQNGRVRAQGLFSHYMSLSEGTEAYRMFDAREEGVIKIMLEVD